MPDFAGKSGRQILDVIDRLEQHRILKFLDVEGGNLGDQSEGFAAMREPVSGREVFTGIPSALWSVASLIPLAQIPTTW